MRYAKITHNDIANGPGVRVSFWTQGCPFRCTGCHNQQTWDFESGNEFTEDTMNEIIDSLNANGVQRNFSILGGEPLCEQNMPLTKYVLSKVKEVYPNITVFLWTGNTIEILKESSNPDVHYILSNIDVLIDGPFILGRRDLTLNLRGSDNQRILHRGIDF